MKKISLIVLAILLIPIGCSFEPIIVHRYYVIDRDRERERALSGVTFSGSVYIKCQEEVWEHGKAPYIRDCD